MLKAIAGYIAGQLRGTGTNDNAVAGNVGQIIESTVLVGSNVTLSTGTPANVTSISLTPGDWDVWGEVAFNPNGATTITQVQGAISTTTGALPTVPGGGAIAFINATLTTGAPQALPVGVTRITVAAGATTTVFLVAQSNFGTNSMAAYGYLGARRVR